MIFKRRNGKHKILISKMMTKNKNKICKKKIQKFSNFKTG